MPIEIGQKVVVLDDVLRGEVISINNQMISIRDIDGMIFSFESKELVVIEENQSELSKYSDINNPLLKDKMMTSKKKPSLFLKDNNEVILEVDLHINQLIKS